jgi:glycosyltransferase involved in cell wall biosynthesis
MSLNVSREPERSARRWRLLCLAPQEPWPPTDGGKEGIHGAVQALSAPAELLLACPGKPASAAAAEHFGALGVRYCPVDAELDEGPLHIAKSMLMLKSFKFHKYGTPALTRRFSAAIGDFSPDAIVCFHAHMEEMAQRLNRERAWRVPVVVREHNIEYELVESYLAALPAWQRRLTAPVAWLTRRAEYAIWRRADVTAFLSDRDHRTALGSGVQGNLVLAPEGVPIPPAREARKPSGSDRLLVPLNRKTPQSVANLRSFLREYWLPLAERGALQGVQLDVTGVNPQQLAEATGISPAQQDSGRVAALGFLPSLQPAFERALAVLAPTFIGGGIRKKVLEAMANQVPVIATDLDIETCSFFEVGRNILRLGSPAEFQRTIESLRRDAVLWQQLSDHGRATVERHANWERFAQVILDSLQRLPPARGTG